MRASAYYSMEKQIDYRICAFCNAPIERGSICDDCSKKYNVKIDNSSEDGCGCDTK
jgi:hypothetical protein